MKAKTINAIVTAKFNSWVGSISDPAVRTLVEKNTIMTGGSITSMLLGEPVNDFDFYFRDFETTKAVAEYYVEVFNRNPPPKFKKQNSHVKIAVLAKNDRVKIVVKSAGIAGEFDSEEKPEEYQYFEQVNPETTEVTQYVEQVTNVLKDKKPDDGQPKYRPVFLSSNAISLSEDIQLVIRFFGDPDKIHENYDFVHCTNYWTSWIPDNGKKLVLRPAALEAILTKELRYIGSKYPLCSLIRLRKFIKREWTINAGQLLKIAMQLHELDLNNSAVLMEQLVGVDMAYFNQLLSYLKANYKGDQSSIDSAYIVEVIDKLF